MKKLLLLLLSLLFAALVFQSCKKLSSNIDEDLVPIVFSQTEITKTAVLEDGEKIEALVLGSQGLRNVDGNLSTPNNWETIYFSSERIGTNFGGDIDDNIANDKVTFTAGNNAMFSDVAYPASASDDIYIKALAPYDAIYGIDGTDGTDGIVRQKKGPEKVIFTIDGTDDVMATGTIVQPVDGVYTATHGVGNRDFPVSLLFERLLSKIDFWIVAENSTASNYWGDFVSITFKNGQRKLEYQLLSHNLVVPATDDLKQDFPPRSMQGGNAEIPHPPGPNPTDADFEANRIFACSIMVFPTTTTWEIEVETQNVTEGTPIARTKLLKSTVTLEKGKQHTITLLFNAIKGIEFGSVIVEPWTEVKQPEIEIF